MTKSWRDVNAIYQIYPRSFKDTNGDGVGDLRGIIEKIDYLKGEDKSLGVDAVWLSPIFSSPQIDCGYDISDYRSIDPLFGGMAMFDELLLQAHKRDLKVMLDLVPNHSSDQHAWFKESSSSRDNSKRDYYIWRDANQTAPRRIIGSVCQAAVLGSGMIKRANIIYILSCQVNQI